MADPRELRTRVAMQALDFSGAFRAVVGHLRLPPAGYVPELMEPEGPSTKGGRQALQRIRLVPTNDKFPTLVVGGANVKSGRAELRSYDYVDRVHRHHFGRSVELDRRAYDQFLEAVKNYFAIAQLEVTIESTPPAPEEAPKPKLPRSLVVLVVLLGVVAAGAFAYLFLHR